MIQVKHIEFTITYQGETTEIKLTALTDGKGGKMYSLKFFNTVINFVEADRQKLIDLLISMQ